MRANPWVALYETLYKDREAQEAEVAQEESESSTDGVSVEEPEASPKKRQTKPKTQA